jgi:phenylpyruvate tautomerase PptA (4-oxalocrotonate tautomerase family)
MPLWIIYHPPNTFTSADTKSALAAAITRIYTAVPLPAFYVNVLFRPVEPSSFYIGGVARPSGSGENVGADESDSTVPFIRITVQHIARTL